jgi:hypothetical protein
LENVGSRTPLSLAGDINSRLKEKYLSVFERDTEGFRHLNSIAEEHDGAGLDASGLQRLDPDGTHAVLVADAPYDGSRFVWLYAVVAMRYGTEKETVITIPE